MSTRISLLEAHIEKLDCLISKHDVPEEIRQWAEDAKFLLENHGTRSHYVTGCRHPLCCKAEADYQANRRKHARDGFVQSVLEDAL